MFSYIKSLLIAVAVMGSTAGVIANTDVEFPEPTKSYLKENMRYEVSDILELETGLNKDQVRHILGNPHFNEGMFSNKVWNYLVDIRVPTTQEYLSCQLRIDFDKQKQAQSYAWKGEQCDFTTFQNIEKLTKQVTQVAPQQKIVEKSASIYFDFDESLLSSVRNKQALSESLNVLKSSNPSSISITGFADIAGKSIYNLNLSRERALVIANYFIQNGIDRNIIQINANGATERFQECRSLDKECNQPNRQVLIKWY